MSNLECKAATEDTLAPSQVVGDPGSHNKAPKDVIDEKPAEKPEPPNGGLAAWLHVLAAFCMFINTWGITQTFGAFQAYYVQDLLSTYTTSSISWIGSMQSFLVVVLGIITGPFFDMGYLRPLISLGCFLVVFGMMMLSLATQYWQVFLAQGVCVGLGAGLVYIPSLALVATQFTTKRPWAIGCASSGSSIGGIIFPIMFRRLQPTVGFGWAVRAIAFVNLGLSAFALTILLRHKGQKSPKLRTLVDLNAFHEYRFALFAFSLLFVFLAFYIPLFYIPVYAAASLGTSQDFAFDLLSITNAGSFAGRTLIMLVATRYGSMQVFLAACCAAIVVLFAWIGIHDVPGFIVFCVLYGIISGVLVTAPSAAISHPVLSPSMSVIGTRMGMSWVFAGVGILIGTPIAGALVNVPKADFLPAQNFAGAVMAVGTLCLVAPLIGVLRHKSS